MLEAAFKVGDGPLTAEVGCEPELRGRYDLKFWEKGKASKLRQVSGRFADGLDDSMPLGDPTAEWDGRLVNVVATLSLPEGAPAVRVTLSILQGTNVLQSDGLDFPAGSAGLSRIVYLKLIAS